MHSTMKMLNEQMWPETKVNYQKKRTLIPLTIKSRRQGTTAADVRIAINYSGECRHCRRGWGGAASDISGMMEIFYDLTFGGEHIHQNSTNCALVKICAFYTMCEVWSSDLLFP